MKASLVWMLGVVAGYPCLVEAVVPPPQEPIDVWSPTATGCRAQ